MASLFNTRISDTYQGLIKTIDNAAITATLKELTDGSGNSTGISLNNAGDFKVNAILEFGSLKDTGENIIITKFVDEADGIANNDNDTSIPTTAAIVDYVAAQITIEDLDFTGDTGSGQIDLDSQIFAIGGTTNEITTVASGQSLTLSLDSTGVNLPDNSTAITQTAGDNSTKIATTSYVDTLDSASDLDFSGDSGTGDVNLNTQTLAVTGTANQIESTASNQGLSLQFPTAGITLPNGSVATTQTAGDNSTKVATTAYVDVLDAASDLDFVADSGSGSVILNSQTLNVVGTANEIETQAGGRQIQIGLPSSISTNLVGDVTGNLTGNVTGDLTGNSAGTHTGAVLGNVTGNVIGNVTGDLTGNADTATAWETARDLSLTGQATGTISSVDGTGNVSGAVTLDNNSVTAKVLTGLPSPSASSVLATDSIVDGIGKLQSQINGLAGGLRFIGSWDADTNSPVLSDGGGEATNGTTTSTSANKLVDSTANFTSTVTVGNQVVNQVDGTTALVTNIDSNTTLSLDGDIMLSGEAYTIDNSPFITQGHYYVVSVGGTTSLNGVSNWTIGDWVIAGANNEWTKLDHSQVDGTGTTGNLTKWSSTSVIADSIVSESGTAITVDGSLTTNTNLSSTGNFAVNTDKFTVGASTGNTAFSGDLAINTDKFTVNATNGNVAAAGTGTFAGDGNIITATRGSFSVVTNLTSVNHNIISTGKAFNITTSDSQPISFATNSLNALTIDTSQNSTFAGTVYIPSKLEHTGDSDTFLNFSDNTITLSAGGSSTTFSGNGNATFAGNITASRGFFNAGATNVVATFTSTDGTSTLQCIDGVGNVEFGASGNDFVVQPAGGVAQLTVGETTSTFAGNVGVGFAAQSNIRTFVYDNSANYSLAVQQDGSGIPFQVTSGGSVRMIVSNSGNVGIGLTGTPSAKFVITGGGGALSENGFQINSGNGHNGTGVLEINPSATSHIPLSILSKNGQTANLVNVTSFGGTAGNLFSIASSGNVGVGTDSIGTNDKLLIKTSVDNSVAQGLVIQRSANTDEGYINYNGGGFQFRSTDGDPIVFGQVSDERMRIDSSGLVRIQKNTASTTEPLLKLSNAYGSTTDGVKMIFEVANTSGNGGEIAVVRDSGSFTPYMAFNVSSGVSSAPTERMRITSGGNVLIGTDSTTVGGVAGHKLVIDATSQNLGIKTASGSNQAVRFANGSTAVGSINLTTSSTSYNTSSDYRLKEDLQDFNGLDKVSKIKMYDFKWKSDDSRSYGVMAHELQEVLPDAVSGDKDAEEMQGVDYSKIVPLLVKSIQELTAEVDKLKQECKCKN